MQMMGISLFELASHRLSYLATRHQTIAENVANADTPGFVGRDLKPFDQSLEEALVRMQQTRAAHMDAGFSQEGRFRFDSKALAWEVTPSGNGVNLEQEMLKATETTAAYALVSNVYKTSQSMLKQALGGR